MMRNNGRAFCFVTGPNGRPISLPEAVDHLALFAKLHAFEAMLVDRYPIQGTAPWSELQQALANGEYSACFQQWPSGSWIEIPCAFWRQERLDEAPMCLSNAQHMPGYDVSMEQRPVFIGEHDLYELVELLRAVAEVKADSAPASMSHAEEPHDPENVIKPNSKAEYDCGIWLKKQFADPGTVNLVKGHFRNLANDIFGLKLSRRAFQRAWDQSVIDLPDRRRRGRRRTARYNQDR